MNQKITEIQIIPIKPNNGLVGFASCVVNDSWHLGSIGIITRLSGGYRLTYPTKTVFRKNMQLYYPISKTVGEQIEEVIVAKYEEVMNKHDRHSSTSAQ